LTVHALLWSWRAWCIFIGSTRFARRCAGFKPFERALFHRPIHQALNRREQWAIVLRYQRHGGARFTGTSGASNAMDVVFGHMR
jgi:hypothetical protein